MASLHEIKGKVDIDTTSVDAAAVKLSVFGREASRSLEDSGRAFVTFGERGSLAHASIQSSSAKTQEDMDRLLRRVTTFAAESGQAFESGTRAMIRLGEDGSASLGKLTTSLTNVTAGVTGAASSLSGLGPAIPYVTVALVALGAALALALAPLLAYTAGLAAVLTLGGGLLTFTGIVGAASIALAGHAAGWFSASENLTKAQKELAAAQEAVSRSARPTMAELDRLHDAQERLAQAIAATDNPWTRFTNRLSQAGKTLGEETAPAAAKLLGWLTNLIDPVERLGSQLFKWFGEQLPKVLPIASLLFNELMEAIRNLGRQLSPIFEKMARDPETFQRAVELVVRQVVDAIVGFVRNLDRLAQWWKTDGQKMASDAGTVLSAIGTAMQILAVAIDVLALTARNIGRTFDILGTAIHNVIQKIQDLIWWINQIPGHKQVRIDFAGGGGGGGGAFQRLGAFIRGQEPDDQDEPEEPWQGTLVPVPA